LSEGEFKKRILKLNENGMWGENEYSLSAHDIFEIMDEARKEFPVKFTWQVMIKEHENGSSTYEEQAMPHAKLPENRANAHINKDEVIDWLLKWFSSP